MECTDLTLPSDCLADTVILKELILCFWGHILYIRNQIPLPLSNITGEALQKSIDADKSKRKAQSDKKLVKFDDRYQSLSLSIDSLLSDLKGHSEENSCAGLKTVCVIIGPSATSSVREAYFLHFEGPPSNNEQLEHILKKSNQCKRQLLRTMITNWNPDPKSSPVTNSYVAIKIHGKPFTLSRISRGGQTDTQLESQLGTQLGMQLGVQSRTHLGTQLGYNCNNSDNSDFTVKEGFKVKLRRRSPAPFHLRISDNSSVDHLYEKDHLEKEGKEGSKKGDKENKDERQEYDEEGEEEDEEVEDEGEEYERGDESATPTDLSNDFDFWLVLRKGIKGVKSKN